MDCSSAGLAHDQKIVAGPGFQVPFAERIRRDAGVMTSAVGLIETKEQVAEILAKGQADLVLMAREFLRDPYWPLRAARELKQPVKLAGAIPARRAAGFSRAETLRCRNTNGQEDVDPVSS